jgi:hypothetical protein
VNNILLETYIKEIIAQELIEEGLDAFLPKTKLEGALQAGILGLMALLGKMMKDNNKLSNNPQQQAIQIVDQAEREASRNPEVKEFIEKHNLDDVEENLEKRLEQMSIDQLYEKYKSGQIKLNLPENQETVDISLGMFDSNDNSKVERLNTSDYEKLSDAEVMQIIYALEHSLNNQNTIDLMNSSKVNSISYNLFTLKNVLEKRQGFDQQVLQDFKRNCDALDDLSTHISSVNSTFKLLEDIPEESQDDALDVMRQSSEEKYYDLFKKYGENVAEKFAEATGLNI